MAGEIPPVIIEHITTLFWVEDNVTASSPLSLDLLFLSTLNIDDSCSAHELLLFLF